MKKPSGLILVSSFLGSNSVEKLNQPFKNKVRSFLESTRNAGINVVITSTLRPSERAYLMHWSWKLSRNLVKPQHIPRKVGVDIDWVHKHSDGSINISKSIIAAKEMVRAYGMLNLNVAPSLNSRHTEGYAIDMLLSWYGTIEIKNQKGNIIKIESLPRDGMNKELHKIGQSFGVIKFHNSHKDKPHWSIDGY
ncbi:peptidoglycan-binding domain-containing protein [Rosenbergiella australiborealis]|uniref:peptidoglycan-binding domain-containing protein n=1 Tax=Rosenbergiella australiborealis TaxID=1544696 RepID=UPI001F4D43E8|nr:peptidoglycan-binding domain-containing protein [Rosenbergiella australiborealis]